MASDDRKRGPGGRGAPGGRAMPKGGSQTPAPKPRLPKGLDPERPAVIGRRPSNPAFLLLVALMWLAVGAIIFFALHTGWRLIPAIFSIGVGLFFLRGAGATVLHRERRRS